MLVPNSNYYIKRVSTEPEIVLFMRDWKDTETGKIVTL